MSLARATMIRRSMQAAGLLDSQGAIEDDDSDMATDFLVMELDALQEQGIVLQNVTRTTLSLVDGTASYTLPSDTLNVVIGPNDFAGTIVTSSATESPVRAISRHQYVTGILNKASEATTPTHVYIEKGATSVSAVFWPTPGDSTMTFRYEKVALNETMDTLRRWQDAICKALSARLAAAKSKPEAVIKRLRDEADEAMKRAKGADQEKMSTQFYVPRWWGVR